MGVEPTAARSARPATGFEDRGIHRDTTTPIDRLPLYQGFWSKQPERSSIWLAARKSTPLWPVSSWVAWCEHRPD